MNVVNQYAEKWNGLAEVAAFCHMICRYFNRFYYKELIENWHQACFSTDSAPGLICDGYW